MGSKPKPPKRVPKKFIDVFIETLGTPYTKKMLEKFTKDKKKYARGGGIRKPKV